MSLRTSCDLPLHKQKRCRLLAGIVARRETGFRELLMAQEFDIGKGGEYVSAAVLSVPLVHKDRSRRCPTRRYRDVDVPTNDKRLTVSQRRESLVAGVQCSHRMAHVQSLQIQVRQRLGACRRDSRPSLVINVPSSSPRKRLAIPPCGDSLLFQCLAQ